MLPSFKKKERSKSKWMHNRTETSAFTKTHFDAYKGLQSWNQKSFWLCVNLSHSSFLLSLSSLFLFFFNTKKVIIPLLLFFKPHGNYHDNRKPYSLVHILCLILLYNLSQLVELEREYRKENKPLEYSLINY